MRNPVKIIKLLAIGVTFVLLAHRWAVDVEVRRDSVLTDVELQYLIYHRHDR